MKACLLRKPYFPSVGLRHSVCLGNIDVLRGVQVGDAVEQEGGLSVEHELLVCHRGFVVLVENVEFRVQDLEGQLQVLEEVYDPKAVVSGNLRLHFV